MSHSYRILLAFLSTVFLSSCISMKLSDLNFRKTDKFRFQSPPKIFVKKHRSNLDYYWEHKKNRSSISIYSSCSGEHLYSSFKDIEKDILFEDKSLKIFQSQKIKHKGIVAKKLILKSKNKKNKLFIELLLIKKKKCIFILNTTAKSQKSYKKNKKIFKNFKKGFQIY